MALININYVIWLLQIIIRLHAKKVLRIVGGQDGDNPKIHQNVVRMELKITPPVDSRRSVKFSYICSATVIRPVWVLTAAHCIAYLEKRILKAPQSRNGVIRYGSVVPWTNDSFSDIIALEKHPSYLNSDYIIKNDIGLMKTAPIHLDHYGKLSAVDYQTLYGHEAIAAGHGVTIHGKVSDNTLALNKTLQVMKVLIRKCTTEKNTFTRYVYKQRPGCICLSRLCGHAAALCPGDSGGPLLHPSGVVAVHTSSNTFDCYRKAKKKKHRNWQAECTPVSPYIDWIQNHIRKN